MKVTVFLLFLYAIDSFAGFTCKGNILVRSASGILTYYKTTEACWYAVNNSLNDFTCDGDMLIGSGEGIVIRYNSFKECWDAVRKSK